MTLIVPQPATDLPHASLWALVLAGGDGTRLQGLTHIIVERTLAIINRDHLVIARPQLRSLDARNVLVQPRNLDTGPGVLLSMLELARRNPDATVAMFPSDHYVRDSGAFHRSIGRMCRVVTGLPQKIALLGACPEHADSGYGYITRGRPLASRADTFAVLAFHEKPAARVAADMVRRGALWNTLVMVARVRRVLELLRALRPADVARLEETPPDLAALATVYDRLPPWNFSREFLSRIPEHLVVTRADDLGYDSPTRSMSGVFPARVATSHFIMV